MRKPIGMPVNALTADCIWDSFRSSGKRHLILTGSKGSGKTTLLRALFPETLPEPVLLQDGFTSLERCMESDSQWITIDEIGYPEDKSELYRDALRQLLEKKQAAMAIRKQNLPFLQELCSREDAFVVDLDDPFGNVGCVIMASGLGKRFGGNKLLADFHGQPLICRILDATEGIFSQRVVVTRSEEVAELCKKQGIQTVLHTLPHRSDTVRLGMEAMPGIDRCVFTPADQPLLRRETVVALALASAADRDSVWRTICGDTPGAPVIFPRWTFPELLNLPEGKGGGFVAKKYPERLRTVSVRDMFELKDVDSPEDLSELLER